MKQIEVLTAEVSTKNDQPIVVPVPTGGGNSPGQKSMSTDSAPPVMPAGPSVAFLTDIVNRVGMGSVFS